MELQYKEEQHVRKSFFTSLLNSAYLLSKARLARNKKQKHVLLLDYNLAENLILVFGFYERKKKG